MRKEIISKWPLINKKMQFKIDLAQKLGKSVKTLTQYWFSKHNQWSFPQKYEREILDFMNETIKAQEIINELEVKDPQIVK